MVLYRSVWNYNLHQIACGKSMNYFPKSLSSASSEPFQHSQKHGFYPFCSFSLHPFYYLHMILISPVMSQTLPLHWLNHFKQWFCPFIQNLRDFQPVIFLCGQHLHFVHLCLIFKKTLLWYWQNVLSLFLLLFRWLLCFFFLIWN